MDISVTDAMLIANVDAPNIWIIAKTVTPDIGPPIRVAQTIPEDSLEWLIAQYDLDPDDKDTLIDMILYWPHLNDGVDDDHPLTWLNAPTPKDAGNFHAQRIKAKKGAGKTTSRRRAANENAVAQARSARFLLMDSANDTATPLEILKRELPIDPELVEIKRQHANQLRQAVRLAGKQTSTDLRARDSKEEHKARLIGRDEHRR